MYRTLSEQQLENLINFYLDKRTFMTGNEMFICELVIERKSMNVEESYIITRLHEDLKNLE